jgi:hypothetical protein
MSSALSLRLSFPTSQDENSRAKQQTQSHGQKNFAGVRRKDKKKAFAFNQRGETRDAKGHQEKPERLPEIQVHFLRPDGGGADEEGKSDDQT